MAGVTGLEPATSGVTGRHSNRLSYTPAGPLRGRTPSAMEGRLRCSASGVKRLLPAKIPLSSAAGGKARFAPLSPILPEPGPRTMARRGRSGGTFVEVDLLCNARMRQIGSASESLSLRAPREPLRGGSEASPKWLSRLAATVRESRPRRRAARCAIRRNRRESAKFRGERRHRGAGGVAAPALPSVLPHSTKRAGEGACVAGVAGLSVPS